MDQHMMIAIILTCILIALDYITGLIKAVTQQKVQSSIMRQGLWHKLAEILAILLAYLVVLEGQHLHLPFDIDFLIPGVVVWITVMEVTSILENIGEINPELKATSFLKIFNQKTDTDNAIEQDKETLS